MYGAFQTYLKIQSNQRELDAVAARLEAVQQRNEDLEGYSQPEFFNNYMEERARAIGYARPNEQVFYITPN
jgi:cell division protein FtsB